MSYVRVEGVSRRSGGKAILRNVSIDVEKGDTMAIMGPSGAGKTSLLRIIDLLDRPDAGRVLVDGLDPWAGNRIQAQRSMAMVFQKPVLLRRTAAANIAYALGLRGVARSERRSRAHQALQLAGLESRASTPARVLSGGEQQRLCLARALSLDPDVLFLDEPTASLDPASTLAIERLLLETQYRGIKIIVVTHDVGQARRLAQEVVFLHHGKLIEHRQASCFFKEPESDVARAFVAGGLVI